MNTKTMQEIYFDLCDLIDSGQIDDIAISEPTPFETLRECLIEQRDKLHPFTIEREAEPAGGNTPGPWALDFGAHDAAIHAGATIAMVDDAMTQWRGNARLIAAAPDLLAALQWAVETADTEQYEADWYAAARVAIAKAQGARDHDENGICRHCGRDNEGYTHEPCSDDCPGRGA